MCVIDTDFLQRLSEIHGSTDPFDLICRFFNALDVKPYLHGLVYQHEVAHATNPLIQRLLNNHIVEQVDIQTVLSTLPGGEQHYQMMVKDLYRSFTGQPYPTLDVLTNWKAGCSIGEVHTASLCAFLDNENDNIWFLSEDLQVFRILGNLTLYPPFTPVVVMNRSMCCDHIRLNPNPLYPIHRKELKYIAHNR
jgi:hypothetical protein